MFSNATHIDSFCNPYLSHQPLESLINLNDDCRHVITEIADNETFLELACPPFFGFDKSYSFSKTGNLTGFGPCECI